MYTIVKMKKLCVLAALLCATLPSSAATAVRLKVTSRELVDKPVSPLLYGNFIESGFGRQVDGMWAEMIFNRSFEAVPPVKRSWMRYGKDVDLTKLPWWHSGYEEHQWRLAPGNSKARFATSSFWGFHHGKLSANLVNGSAGQTAALVQDGLYLRRGMAYRFRGYAKPGRNPRGKSVVTVALQNGDVVLAQKQVEMAPQDWTAIEAEFRNPTYEGRASLVISIPPGGDIFLDDLSLMPADNIDGWRRDVVERLREVRPAIIRFPGGCFATFYHWRDGVGNRSDRHPQESDFWGGLEYNDAGTDEFIELCRLLKAEPFPVINMMSGSPEEAAAWVAYCNAPASDPMGRLRAANGHPEPYHVKYWEMDNETYRKWSVAEYARECIRFSKAMKAADSSIQLVAVSYGQFAQNAREFLELAGPDIDLLSDRAKGERHMWKKIQDIRDYNRRTGRHIRLANTEWLAPWTEVDPDSDLPGGMLLSAQDKTIPLQEKQISWRYGLNAAATLLMFQRLGGDFEFANFNNMANSWGQNVVECPKEPAYISAAGRVLEAFSATPAAWPLAIEGLENRTDLKAQVAWDAQRKNLVLYVLNYGSAAAETAFDLSGLRFKPDSADITQLWADSLMAHNTTADPDAIRRKHEAGRAVAGETFTVTAVPYSLTIAVLRGVR